MKITVDSAFADFDSSLNLDPAVRLQAQERHNAVRDELTRAGLIGGSFLQGSFARKTMLRPLKDVDIVCLLVPDKWESWSGPDGPGRAMESFKAPIRRRWPSVEFDVGDEPSGKALRLTFPNLSFTIDLVPAFEDGSEMVLIGDRFEGTWTPSNTRVQLANVRARNQATNGRFVHQVRELKSLIKNYPELGFIKGIVVESLTYAAVPVEMADKHALATTLAHASLAVAGPVLEPAGDDDVTVKWSPEERRTAGRVLGECAERANEAVAVEEEGDQRAAVDAWHDLIGGSFPPAPARSTTDVLASLAGGGVTRAGRPTTSRAARQQSAPGRSWSRR